MMLRLVNVSKEYDGGVTAVDRVSLEVPERQFVAVMGRSGSGKSTLLNLIAGIDRPSSGEIWVGEQELSTLGDDALTRLRRERLGIVFQFFNLLTNSAEAAACAERVLEMSDGRLLDPHASSVTRLHGYTPPHEQIREA